MGVITRVQVLGGTAPLKFGSAKNAQNLVRLMTTFDFERKYLNCIGISTSGKRRYQIQLIPRWIKKLCELQSTNIKDYAANVYPRKSNFLEGHISAPRGCCTPKLLHALENDQFLVAHPPTEMGAPLQVFSKRGQKLA